MSYKGDGRYTSRYLGDGYLSLCQPKLILIESVLFIPYWYDCPQDLPWLLSWLSAQPSVKWVAPAPELRLHNLVAGAITETGALRAGQDAASLDLHPFWAVGSNGYGWADSIRQFSLCRLLNESTQYCSYWGSEHIQPSPVVQRIDLRFAVQQCPPCPVLSGWDRWLRPSAGVR